MTVNVFTQLIILAQPQGCANDLDGDHLALAHGCLWARSSHLLAFHHSRQPIVSPTQTGNNKLVQVHSIVSLLI
jgi:hypothetical protein